MSMTRIKIDKEATLEVREMMISKGLVPCVDLLRRNNGRWEFAILRSDNEYEWFPISQSPIPVEKYLKARDKLTASED